MALVHNLPSVAKTLTKLSAQYPLAQDVSVIVGYQTKYALAVHETPRNYNNGKKWKYLETPAREKRREIAHTVRQVTISTRDLGAGLVMGGLLLQRESQKIVPIDTGTLRASAFTKKEDSNTLATRRSMLVLLD